MFRILLLYIHLIGATIWVGGHLIVATLYLPEAFRIKSLENLFSFEGKYEKIGMIALFSQLLTGLYLAMDLTNNYKTLFDTSSSVSQLILIKLLMFIFTIILALDVKLRVMSRQASMNKIIDLSLHILPVTLFAVLFVLCGLLIRFGGFVI